MPTHRLFMRDRGDLARRLCLALVLSVVGHTALIFGVPGGLFNRSSGSLFSGGSSTQTRTLEARLVASRAVQTDQPARAAAVVVERQLVQELTPVSGATPIPTVGQVRRTGAPTKIVRATARPMAAVIAESYPAISLPLPFDPVFYTWREVDVIARLHGEGSPPYPAAAREAGLSGRITLEVWVDETGHVHEVKVIDATPHGYFEAAALAHYRAARFSPAMKDGQPRRFHARFLLEFSEPAQEPQ